MKCDMHLNCYLVTQGKAAIPFWARYISSGFAPGLSQKLACAKLNRLGSARNHLQNNSPCRHGAEGCTAGQLGTKSPEADKGALRIAFITSDQSAQTENNRMICCCGHVWLLERPEWRIRFPGSYFRTLSLKGLCQAECTILTCDFI